MGTIETLKEQEVLETPLLLFECELPSGATERWSTNAVQVNGDHYEPRVLGHNVLEMRALSEEGIDAVSRVSITLANTDSRFSQIARTAGWKGSRLTVRFLFFNLATGSPASEDIVLFHGVANPPDEITETTCRLTFLNRLGLYRILLPEIRIQRRCPWTFPATEQQRNEAITGGAKGRYSPFFRCGYSAGLPGGVGNLNGGEAFLSCDCTRAACVERGMFNEDAAGNLTRRFGGIEFVPATVEVRSYGEQGAHAAVPVENRARYNDFVPLVYGTVWYEPPIVFARNDGNLTRMEILLGMGEIESVLKVVVNGLEIPTGQTGTDMTDTGWFNIASHGGRAGGFNLDFRDKADNPLGDPYGSMACLSVVVPNHISQGRSLPRVQVLVEGMKLDRYDTNGAWLDTAFTNNPAWVLLDILRRCGWNAEEINLASFAKAAEFCGELIPVTDLYGNTVQAPRCQCNLVVRKRRSAADVVRGVRNASGLFLTYGAGGQIELQVENSLALQQPEKPVNSNSEAELNGGWPAYEFGDGSSGFSGIMRRENGRPSLRLWSQPTADSPNRYSVEFQDEFNEYQQDSLSLVDTDDVLRTGQEVSARLSALGLPNFAQAARMIRRQIKKNIEGNLFVEFESSIRAIGLKPGDLITLTYLKEGFLRQPFRVLKIVTGSNHETSVLTCRIHEDAWYADDLGGAGGATTRRQRSAEVGMPKPLVGSVIDENGDSQFGVSESVTSGTDGAIMVTLSVSFIAPPKPEMCAVGIPLLSLAPEVNTAVGTLAGEQTLYYAVSALDGNGSESGLSFVVRATIPAGSETNTVTLRQLSFSAGTTGFNVYRGNNPSRLLRIASGVAVAAEFTDSGLSTTLAPPPDENYDHARFDWRMELVPEQSVTSHSPNTIGNNTLQMIDNEHAGKVVRITSGKGFGQERAVLSNDAHTLTVTPSWDTEPDETSKFVVAESSWHFGAAGVSSPIEFEVPNREGATVHISGRSVNAQGRECAYELSPLTRWGIGGSSGLSLDIDVPSQPVFGLFPTGQGTVELVGIGFSDLTNTRSIQAATLTLHYWNELNSPTGSALGTALGETGTIVELATAAPAPVGTLIQVGSELLVVEETLDDGLRYEVTRGSHGTTPQAFAAGTLVYHLDRKVFVVPFVRDFFGSPASGSFSYPIFIPDVRVAAAEMFVTNVRGNSESARNNFTGTTDRGLRTLSGGQMSIQVEGFLAIESNAAPPLVIEDPHSVRDIFAVVRKAPTGAPVELRIYQDEDIYCNLTIPAGETMSNIVGGFGLPALREKSELRLDIVSVGQTADTTPGSDLTVTIRL